MCCTMTHHRDVRVRNHHRCVCVVIAYHSHARIRQGIRFCASTASRFPFFHLYPSLDPSFTSLRHPQTLYRVQLRALRDAHLRIRRVRRPTRPCSPATTILWEPEDADSQPIATVTHISTVVSHIACSVMTISGYVVSIVSSASLSPTTTICY